MRRKLSFYRKRLSRIIYARFAYPSACADISLRVRAVKLGGRDVSFRHNFISLFKIPNIIGFGAVDCALLVIIAS